MDDRKTASNPQPNRWSSWLFLRWFIGALAGYISSIFLFVISESVFPPLLEPAIAGQEELFDVLIYFILDISSISKSKTGLWPLFVYSTVWGLIGALLASGSRKQTKIGLEAIRKP